MLWLVACLAALIAAFFIGVLSRKPVIGMLLTAFACFSFPVGIGYAGLGLGAIGAIVATVVSALVALKWSRFAIRMFRKKDEFRWHYIFLVTSGWTGIFGFAYRDNLQQFILWEFVLLGVFAILSIGIRARRIVASMRTK